MSNTTTLQITHTAAFASVYPRGALPGSADSALALQGFVDLLNGISGGSVAASVRVHAAGTAATQASGTLTLSSASGTVGGVINGVTVTVTASGGDTTTAAAIATAINASSNALVKGIVTASAAAAVVTVTSVEASKTANAITLTASGSGVTASGSGRLTGGAGNDVAAVTFSKL